MTSADPHHKSSCGRHAPAASPKYGSLQNSGQDCWQATLYLLPKIPRRFNLFTLNVLLHPRDVTAETAVSNTVLEIELCCLQILKVNDFVTK